jgi:hypothetical protein
MGFKKELRKIEEEGEPYWFKITIFGIEIKVD